MSHFHSLTIKSIDKVTDTAVAITFDVPENLKEKFSFKAGQYITLKTLLMAKTYEEIILSVLQKTVETLQLLSKQLKMERFLFMLILL